MTTLNNSPPSKDDQIPKHPIEAWLEWLPILIIIMVFLILDILFMITFRVLSNNPLASPENSEGDLQRLDLIAPPQTYKQVTTEMEIEGPGEHSAWPDALIICVICLETMVDCDIVRRLPCGHIFHSGCITPWYLGQHYTCPLCISHFMSSEPAHV
ncbi:hypothetical protein DER46DRAFT_545918 [Fusarium sp. MPI-SDFR-AT-0072]|nr:hypothetical protein DER46DRAFT_545918 [Fusarium sp. MPI-SDFR-AT-0072]